MPKKKNQNSIWTYDKKFEGRTTYGKPPYKRKDGGKFTYTENLSQKDLAYLGEVLKVSWVYQIDKPEEKPKPESKKSE